MKISGIYQIQSKIKPERIYIGSACSISRRWVEHMSMLRNNKHGSQKLQNHYNKYGEGDLVFSILLGCDKDDLIKVEQYFIDTYNPWFNMSPIAKSPMKGRKHTDEARAKMSKVHKGSKRSEETRRKMSEAQMGEKNHRYGKTSPYKGKTRIYSEEALAKMRRKRKITTLTN